jgi:hypothetical protein
VHRAYKFLLPPTVRQRQALGEMLRDHCSHYNGALQERRDAYRHVSKTSVTYGQQSAQLKEIRAFDPERQGRWSFSTGAGGTPPRTTPSPASACKVPGMSACTSTVR